MKIRGNKTIRPILLTLAAIFFVLSLGIGAVSAHNVGGISDLEREISINREALEKLRQGEVSYKKLLTQADLEIRRQQLSIAKTEGDLVATQHELGELTNEIGQLEAEVARKKIIMVKYLREIHSTSQVSTAEIIARSETFGDFINRSENLQQIQERVYSVAEKVKQLKIQLGEKRERTKTRETELLGLKTSLVNQRNGLTQQKNVQQSLLSQNKQQQAGTLDKIAKAQAEISRLSRSIGNRLRVGDLPLGRRVGAGEQIGNQGNTGYSCGSHLHFEVQNSNGDHVNPMSYLGSTFRWPMSGYEITQGYGRSSWTSVYSFHTGIDMASHHGSPILAAGAGNIVLTGYYSGNTCSAGIGNYGNYIVIKHDNGMYTLYAHLL